ncbi:MAG: MotA/TolQ/ExbB proton channel family protein [SAR86 cluster bacterium]|nr:MotA/TolQ/ExbB proton channel family protein [SAR86 cluster bacterium]
MLINKKQNYLLLKASLLLSLIIFAGYLIIYLGLFELIIESDRSRISVLILVIYLLATVHWFMNVLSLDKEIASIDKPSRETLIGRFNIEMTRVNEKDHGSRLGLLEDELSNKNALGYLIVDILLKLGLTGTVIGFILMLLPIGEIKDFDPQILQKLLSTMSGGMAVALYTTLTGLISSMLLKFQYFLIDSSLSQTLNYLNSKYE